MDKNVFIELMNIATTSVEFSFNNKMYSAVHNSGATLRNLSIFFFQAIFIYLYELCIYMLYIFVKGMLQVI